MKIFFEEYVYKWDDVKEFLHDHYVMYLKDGKVTIPYVGYYYSQKATDAVFVLPKVFINITKDKEELAFGQFHPEQIIDTKNPENPLLKSQYFNEVFNLSTWIYRAIARYQERHDPENITESVEVQNVESVKGDNSETWINIILELIRFNNEHRNLFTYIARINSQGHNKINWQKTISKIQPILQDDSPVYLRFRNKQKVFNYDEELIVLFFSVLDYLHDKYHFRILRNVNYETYPKEVEKLIESGKGTKLLKGIRRKYFKDELVKLWHLLNVFFEKAQTMQSKSFHEESLMVRNFNMVFEDMIDSLISDDTKDRHPDLKDQPDGKIVDHIYQYPSLICDDHIYYIGDSKYYKESNKLQDNSIYKQFTYAKNVIQYNIDIFNERGKKNVKGLKYRDDETEGYNITPNFFIRGKIGNRINYTDDELTQKSGDDFIDSLHFKNRLFDRDTLLMQEYSINFLFVLAAYASNYNDEGYRKYIKDKFKKNLTTALGKRYHFYLIQARNYPRKAAIDKHFRTLNGKVYPAFKDDRILLLAYEKGKRGIVGIFEEIKDDFRIFKYQLGQELQEALKTEELSSIDKLWEKTKVKIIPLISKSRYLAEDTPVYNHLHTLFSSDIKYDWKSITSIYTEDFELQDNVPGMNVQIWHKLVSQLRNNIAEEYYLEIAEV